MTRSADRDGPADPGGVLGLLAAPLTPELLLDVLHAVIDPELGVNIVDLGLVYDLDIAEDGTVEIAMTLTTPGCPLGGFLEDEIHDCLSQLPRIRAVSVRLVWEPPWDPEMMSDAAREQMGWSA